MSLMAIVITDLPIMISIIDIIMSCLENQSSVQFDVFHSVGTDKVHVMYEVTLTKS